MDIGGKHVPYNITRRIQIDNHITKYEGIVHEERKMQFINNWNEGKERKRAPKETHVHMMLQNAEAAYEIKLIRNAKLKELYAREHQQYVAELRQRGLAVATDRQ